MSLKSQPEYLAAAAFETETTAETTAETTTETTTKTKDETMTTNTKQQDAGVVATTAIARAATTPNAVDAYKTPTKFRAAFSDKENNIPVADVEMWHQAAPAITAEQGVCKHSKKGKLGGEIEFLIESYNLRYMAVSGSNDKESKDYCRNSFDKLTLAGEDTLVVDYLNGLKAEGFDKAHLTTYVDVWGYVVGAEKPEYADPEELVRLQLSSTSSANFGYFCGQRGRAESSGRVAKLETIMVMAEAQEGRNGSYTNFSFTAPKAK